MIRECAAPAGSTAGSAISLTWIVWRPAGLSGGAAGQAAHVAGEGPGGELEGHPAARAWPAVSPAPAAVGVVKMTGGKPVRSASASSPSRAVAGCQPALVGGDVNELGSTGDVPGRPRPSGSRSAAAVPWPKSLRIHRTGSVYSMTWSFAGPDARALFRLAEISGEDAPSAERGRGMHERLRPRARRVQREPETPRPVRGRSARRAPTVPHGEMLRGHAPRSRRAAHPTA